MTVSSLDTTLSSRSPYDGRVLAGIAATSIESIPSRVTRARTASLVWSSQPLRERLAWLRRWYSVLVRRTDELTDRIIAEIGKPRAEALAEVLTTLDLVRWTIKQARACLRSRRIEPGLQRFLLVNSARVDWLPWGVVGIWGTWNYPLYLNVPAIAQALVAGNAVVFKPSESAIWVAEAIRETLDDAGTPEGLVDWIFGGPDVGRALTEAELDKGFYTGGIGGGRAVASTLAGRGIPAVVELSGFDAAVVLPDSDPDPTVRALTWGAFVGCGQTCVAVKRVYAVGFADVWAERLGARARALRPGDPSRPDVDLGPMISVAALERFADTLARTVEAGARVVAGGRPIPGPGSFFEPTVLVTDKAEPEAELAGCFGPVVLVRSVSSVEAAIEAVNASPWALGASVWGQDRRAASRIAGRLKAGIVSVNDAVAPSAHAGAPFGGMRASGFGRTHGVEGFREFVQPRSLSSRSLAGWRPHLYPYGPLILRLLQTYRKLVHGRG